MNGRMAASAHPVLTNALLSACAREDRTASQAPAIAPMMLVLRGHGHIRRQAAGPPRRRILIPTSAY